MDTDNWGPGPDGCSQSLLHRAVDENREEAACFLVRSGNTCFSLVDTHMNDILARDWLIIKMDQHFIHDWLIFLLPPAQHQDTQESEGSQRQGCVSGLVLGQAAPGVQCSGWETHCLGRFHHQQGARPHPAHHLGHGLCVLTQWFR